MKYSVFLFFLVFGLAAHGQMGKATTTKKTFSRETTVSTKIYSEPKVIWAILTNAKQYPDWNSTVTSLEGEIALGEKIELKSILDENRTFKLKVKEMESPSRMVWADGQGKRVYTLETVGTEYVVFTMTEKIGGLMFPMYANQIPAFDEVFEKFAADLKAEAEGDTY